MSSCRFGTDGIRGRIGSEPMVPDTLMRLGYAIGTVLGGHGREVVLGKDTRLSGYMVESAIEAGLAATGIDIALTGPLPTSAVAYLVARENAAAGIVISASHNPYYDNGIKVFDAQGNKLSDEMEDEIEELVERSRTEPVWAAEPGKARRLDDASEHYMDFCLQTEPQLRLEGMHVVIDGANGAAYACAPEILRRAGAQVYEFGCAPDGRNINVDCGALHPQKAVQIVTRHNYDLGIVLDGDADRVMLIDANGRLLDGDACLYALCKCLAASGRKPAGAAGTLMSNEALVQALGRLDIDFARADVGDRNVVKMLKQQGWLYGSEPSGHMLLLDRHVTGDGMIAALAVLAAVAAANTSLAEAAADFQPLPTASASIAAADPGGICRQLADVVAAEQQRLDGGRMVLRPSGTEPVLRLLVEAEEREIAVAAADRIENEARKLISR